MTEHEKLWWHVYSYHDEENDLYASMTIGPSSFGPDDPAEHGKTPREFTPDVGLIAIGRSEQNYAYRTSFEHEPTEDDMDDLAPEGHRSWEIED